MNAAKIRLSPEEMALLKDAAWILTKNRALDKIRDLLAGLLPAQQAILDGLKKAGLPEEVTTISPKISRGENYQGLPWVILDHPRCFEKGHVFAVRTLFWWGRSFSITLHLSGRYKEMYRHHLARHLENIHPSPNVSPAAGYGPLYLCVNEKEWEHHFEPANYLPLDQMDAAARRQILEKKSFVKLAFQIPLTSWQNTEMPEEMLVRQYESLLKLLVPEN